MTERLWGRRRLLAIVVSVLLLAIIVFAQVKDSQLTRVTTVADADLSVVTINLSGTPLTRGVLISNLFTGRTLPAIASLGIRSSGAAFDLRIASSEVLTANRALSITLNDAARSLTIAGDAVVAGTNTGDQTITLSGDVSGSGTSSITTTIGATKVTSAMLNSNVFSTAHSWSGQQTFTAPILGTPASGVATNLTGLPPATGIVGWPANASGVLTNNGSGTLSWGAGGGGSIGGSTGSTDNAILRADGTGGATVQSSLVTINDAGDVTAAAFIGTGSGAGYLELTQGSAPSLGTTSIQIVAPASVTSYQRILAGAAGTGIPHFANSANVVTETISAIVEADITLADNTTNNFSTTAHGFVPKGTNVGNFLKDDGTWAAAGGGLPSGLTFSSPDFTVATAAANQVVISGSTTTNPAKVVAAGSDSNITLLLQPKGSGVVKVTPLASSTAALSVTHTNGTVTAILTDQSNGGGGELQLGAFNNANVRVGQTLGAVIGNDLIFGWSSGSTVAGGYGLQLSMPANTVLKVWDGTAGAAIQLPQKTATPANPGSSAEVNFYIKGNKIVFQYNDAGTVRYATYDLTQSATAVWATSTSAP